MTDNRQYQRLKITSFSGGPLPLFHCYSRPGIEAITLCRKSLGVPLVHRHIHCFKSEMMTRPLTPFGLQSAVQEGNSWRKIGLKEEDAKCLSSEKWFAVEMTVIADGRDEKRLHNFSPENWKIILEVLTFMGPCIANVFSYTGLFISPSGKGAYQYVENLSKFFLY